MKKENQKLINNLKKILRKEKGILFCYLFGSRAYQGFTPKSDIDIAVYLDEKKYEDFFEKRLELIFEISKNLKKEADVVILNTAPLILKYMIFNEGKLIFEKEKEKRMNFELKTMREYFDFKPILEKYYQRILAS